MARKKITSLLGKDSEYSKEFSDTPTIASPTLSPNTHQSPSVENKVLVEPSAKPKRATREKPVHEPKAKTDAEPETPNTGKPTRAVHVRAAAKKDHNAGLIALEKAGLPISDVVRLAGKRAIKAFKLKNTYVAPAEVERLPSEVSFRTMKTLDAKTLDTLRDQADPLRLRSDAAVIQGQLEPLFWRELDAVIIELRKKYL